MSLKSTTHRYRHRAILTVVTLAFSPFVQADLIGWWDFEEGSGPTTADQSGNGRTGTLGAGATWSTTEFAPVPSGSTASIEFDGTDLANVIINGYKADEIGGTNPRTLAAWIKTAPGVAPTSNLGIFGYGENQAGEKWNFRVQDGNGPIDGNIRVEVNGGYIIGSTVVVDGEWHHVAMTFEDDGSPNVLDVLLYVDGELEEISASLDEPVNTDTTNGIDLAISDDHSNREWDGWLDDIRVYNEVLTPEQIKELANGAPIIGSFSADAEVVEPGGALTLSWEVDAFDTLEIEPGVGDVAPQTVDGQGSIELMPTETTTYTIMGTIDGKRHSAKVFVLVGEAPLIGDFSVVGTGAVPSGEMVGLSWSTFGATSLSIDPVPGEVTGEVETTVMPTDTTVYTLNATNAFGTTTAEVTVTVRVANLIARYNFTTEPNPTVVDESPGGTNNAEITFNGTSPTWLAEDSGRTGVLSFDDTPDGNIRLISPPTIPAPDEGFTVMLWAKSDNPDQGQYGSVFANGQGGTNHFQIDADGAGQWRLHTENAFFGPIVDEWTHLAVTWDGATRRMYYNGEVVHTSSSNPGSSFDEYRMGVNRANDGPGAVDAEIDDVRIYDFALSPAGVVSAMNDTDEEGLRLAIKGVGSDLLFSWNSKAGKVYDIRTSTDLTGDPAADWPVWQADIAATPSLNEETYARPTGPGEETRFFVVVEKEAPPIFADDFESESGWTTGVNDAVGDTQWQRGAPTNVGPATGAGGSANCFGTNIDANYALSSDAWLRSPSIDLTDPAIGGARLTFQQFKDIEAGFDFGSIRVLRASDGAPLGADIAMTVDGVTADWEQFSAALPSEAIGETIVLEFQFVSDELAAFAGWYLDDVEVSIE